MDPRDRTRALFDRLADSYDNVGVDYFQPIAAGLVAELAPRPGERALDIGCGRGAALLPLARAVAPDGTATGIDLSPRMVELARDTAAAAGLTVDVRVGDAGSPDLPPASYDVIASSLVLFFLPDPAAALRTWLDLLVPGGRLGISTFGAVGAEWTAVDDVFTPYLPPALRDPRTSGKTGPFASAGALEALFDSTGADEPRTATTVVPIRFRDKDHWHEWSWSVGMRAMWESVPEDKRDAVRALAYERLDACRMPDGRLGFDQEVRYTLGRRASSA